LICNLADFLPKKYREPSHQAIDFYRNYFYHRLKKTNYQLRIENNDSIAQVVDFFVRLHLHRESLSLAQSELKKARYDYLTPDNQATTLIAPPPKGLFIFGGCGTGKSSLIQRLSCNDNFKINNQKTIKIDRVMYLTSEEIVENYAVDGVKYIRENISENSTKTMIIDELGGEPYRVYYSNGECMEDVIRKRYDDYVTRGALTVFLSNFGSEELPLSQRYSSRIVSRLHEMCDAVPFIGRDWRIQNDQEA
jgi:DNA replication protein DnaC